MEQITTTFKAFRLGDLFGSDASFSNFSLKPCAYHVIALKPL